MARVPRARRARAGAILLQLVHDRGLRDFQRQSAISRSVSPDPDVNQLALSQRLFLRVHDHQLRVHIIAIHGSGLCWLELHGARGLQPKADYRRRRRSDSRPVPRLISRHGQPATPARRRYLTGRSPRTPRRPAATARQAPRRATLARPARPAATQRSPLPQRYPTSLCRAFPAARSRCVETDRSALNAAGNDDGGCHVHADRSIAAKTPCPPSTVHRPRPRLVRRMSRLAADSRSDDGETPCQRGRSVECFDLNADLLNCGGCGRDCTTIAGSVGVGCQRGQCVVCA